MNEPHQIYLLAAKFVGLFCVDLGGIYSEILKIR